jgi:hypothetical protein
MVFYGTDRWAVNFIISNFVPQNATIPDTFIVHDMRVYIPQPVTNARISLHHNHLAQPGSMIYTIVTDFASGWNDISLPTPTAVSNAWLIVEYQTHIDGPYVATSSGSGMRSFFFDRATSGGGIFQSMGGIGFRADLLFTIVGTFSHTVMMIDIMEYTLPFTIYPNEPFLPDFIIKNNSPQPASDVYLKFTVKNSHFTHTDSLVIATVLAENELLSSQDIAYPGITLPSLFGQYEVEFTVGCAVVDGVMIPKSRFTDIDIFGIDREKSLLEVFACTAYTLDNSVIAYLENNVDKSTTDIIYYFPNSIDTHYRWAAYQRSTQYSHFGNEHIYYNGHQRNSNFSSPHFFSLHELYYQNSLAEKTFITASRFSLTFRENSTLAVQVSLSNESFYILNKNQNNYVVNHAIIQPIYHQGHQLNIISQFITNPIGRAVNLAIGETVSLADSIAHYMIDYIGNNTFNDLSVFTWVHDRFSAKVYFHKVTPLSTAILSGNDEVIIKEQPSLQVYPNPAIASQKINVRLPSLQAQTDIAISLYNIKGQKVDISTTHGYPSAYFMIPHSAKNGIYFLRASWIEEGKEKSLTRKLMILRQ